ncbi:MAG: hypothetical protein MUC69_04670, partial [Gemmatimonadales bacterium]|nr:hypothetical protein [Gemmatimonadales bacterium]
MRPTFPILGFLLALASGCGGERAPARSGADTTPAASAAPALRLVAQVGDSASTIEGLAAHGGVLYTADWKDGTVYRIDPAAGTTAVASLPSAPG